MTTGWQHAARLRLTGRGDVHLRLGELIPASELPPWPCYLPWIRLEISTARLVGPCCSDYQVAPFRRDGSIELGEMWNAPELQAFRRNMSSGGHLTSCRTTCPVLAGATARVPDLVLRGGTAAFVEHEIAATQAMLDGELELRTWPLDVTFPPTTYCNYDCLMCEWGEMGTLADELDESFYASLSALLPTLRTIGVSGGEPLASPRFRRFLAELDWAVYPDLRLSLITNGSYLTLEEQERLARVPFSGITLSLNAASPGTYELVNRGLPWTRMRGNLDGLLQRRRDGQIGRAHV